MNKMAFAIIVQVGIFVSTLANAQQQLYQCRPITCNPGKYFNMANKQCEDCSADEYCLNGKKEEGSAKDIIIEKFKDKLLEQCLSSINDTYDNFISKGGYGGCSTHSIGNRRLTSPVKSLAVNVNYNGELTTTTASKYSHSAGSEVFTINCVNDVPEFATKGRSAINEQLAKGQLSKANKDKTLADVTDTETFKEKTSIEGYSKVFPNPITISTTSGSLSAGLYAVILEGAGGGGGGAGNTGQDGGDGGWGQAKMGHFLILDSTSYTATIGTPGHGGEGEDSGCDGGDGKKGGDTTFKIAGLTFKALGGYGGVGTNACSNGKRGNANKREHVDSSGSCSGGRRDGSQSAVRQPGCGDDWKAWGSGGGPGAITVYKLEP